MERHRGEKTMAALYDRFFQLGYVTRDLDAAMGQFSTRFGPAEFQIIHGQPPHLHTKRIALTYVGQTMVELIEVNDQVPSIYKEYLPPPGGDIRIHHTGHLIDDTAATLRRVEAEGYPIAMKIS